ncbi:MAG: hypothetical protein FWH12_08885 [Treponema sp.]|nr:hypothetical protein [Treponema sp.]
MRHHKGIVGSLMFIWALSLAPAQEVPLDELPGLREQAVVIHIISRILEHNQQVVWDSENIRVTIPGRPVGLQLVGSNLVVVVQFTPFLQSSGQHMLVAQGQIWINIPGEGMHYQTTMQMIPLRFGEPVFFFPLGTMMSQDSEHIEVLLTLEPYLEEAHPLSRGDRD